MIEELAGCFIKIPKSSNLPVTRYFLLDLESKCLRYFETSIQLRRVINKNLSWDQATKTIDSHKVLDLQNFKLGPKSQISFSVRSGCKELTVFPWNTESVDKLYQKFSDLQTSKKKLSFTEAEQSPGKIEMSQLEGGNMYCGDLNDEGLPHGNNGREFCEDGSIFYGSFRMGKWHGVGCIINSNLDMDQKEYIAGVLCGI